MHHTSGEQRATGRDRGRDILAPEDHHDAGPQRPGTHDVSRGKEPYRDYAKGAFAGSTQGQERDAVDSSRGVLAVATARVCCTAGVGRRTARPTCLLDAGAQVEGLHQNLVMREAITGGGELLVAIADTTECIPRDVDDVEPMWLPHDTAKLRATSDSASP